jgi:hypothetical protein
LDGPHTDFLYPDGEFDALIGDPGNGKLAIDL